MRKSKLSLVVVSALLSGALGQANAQSSSVAQRILDNNEAITVLSVELRKLELDAQIAAKKKEIAELGINYTATETHEIRTAPPNVVAIEGVDGKLKATLLFGEGLIQVAAQGEVIKDGWTVIQITPGSVDLTRNGERVRLGFGSTPPQTPQPGAPASAFPNFQ